MYKQNQKRLGFILLIVLFLSAMYFEHEQKASLLYSASVRDTISCISQGYVAVENENVCTTEMLRNHSSLGLHQSYQHTNQKRELRVSLDSLCAALFSLSEKKFVAAFERIQPFRQKPDRLVTNYIHKSDGKK